MGKLLIHVRGPKEASEAVRGGAHLVDVEYPGSMLGTPYPFNIHSVRERLNAEGYDHIPVAANTGEKEYNRALTCQAVLGAATAGADIVRCGFAELSFKAAVYAGEIIVRTVKKFYPEKRIIPSLFVDRDMQRFLDPVEEGPALIEHIHADGVMLDTYNRILRNSLLDFVSLAQIALFVGQCHEAGKEVWLSGNIAAGELHDLWETGADVLCIREAACEQHIGGRTGEISADIIAGLLGPNETTNIL